MPKTITYDSLHYCVTCDDCGQQSDYDGRIGNTEMCQHVNTTANYECHCNLWTQILLDDLFYAWASDSRYRRNEKHAFQIVNRDTGEILKEASRDELWQFPWMGSIIAGSDNQEFTQRWTLSGSSLTIHHKSTIRDDIYVIHSARD